MKNDEVMLVSEDIHFLTREQAWHYRILPKCKLKYGYEIYCEQSADEKDLKAELEILFGMEINLAPLPNDLVAQLLSKYYIKDRKLDDSQILVNNNADEFLNNLIHEAKNLKSSDIHIESYEHKCRVRIRVDGMLIERYLLKREDYPALINKIKIFANLDIAEKRLPQDGRINSDHLNSNLT